MFGASSMLCRSTLTFTTLAREEPAAWRTSLRFSRIRRVSLAVVPRIASPLSGSTAVSPETKTNAPPRTAKDACRLGARLGSRPGRGDVIAPRGRVTGRPFRCASMAIEGCSLAAKTGQPDHLGKSLDVGAQDLVEFLRRGRRQEIVEVLEAFLDIGQVENAPDLAVYLVQDGTWRSARRK